MLARRLKPIHRRCGISASRHGSLGQRIRTGLAWDRIDLGLQLRPIGICGPRFLGCAREFRSGALRRHSFYWRYLSSWKVEIARQAHPLSGGRKIHSFPASVVARPFLSEEPTNTLLSGRIASRADGSARRGASSPNEVRHSGTLSSGKRPSLSDAKNRFSLPKAPQPHAFGIFLPRLGVFCGLPMRSLNGSIGLKAAWPP